MYIVYMWIKSMEHCARELNAHLSPVVTVRSICCLHSQRRESIVWEKCTYEVHRGFPNDWPATSFSDRNLQVKIPGENPRWVVFLHGVLEFHGFRSLLIGLTYARVQVIDKCIKRCIESSVRKHMLTTSSAKCIWFPFLFH